MSNRTDLERDARWERILAASRAANTHPEFLAFVKMLGQAGKVKRQIDNRTDDEKDRDEDREHDGYR